MAATTTKTDAAHDWLRAQIKSGRFGPGHRLVVARLTEETRISAVPFREALRRLEAAGLVRYEPNIGATVALADDNAYGDVMETLAVIEGAATRLTVGHLSADDLSAAADINEELRALTASLERFDPERFTQLNRDFHTTIFRKCPNVYLRETVEHAWRHLDDLRATTFSFIPGRAVESVREHDELLRLLTEASDPDVIERRAREHRLATLHAYQNRTAS